MIQHRKIIKKANATLTIADNGYFYVTNSDVQDDEGKAFETLREAKVCFCETIDNGEYNYPCWIMTESTGSGTSNKCHRCWLGWV